MLFVSKTKEKTKFFLLKKINEKYLFFLNVFIIFAA